MTRWSIKPSSFKFLILGCKWSLFILLWQHIREINFSWGISAFQGNRLGHIVLLNNDFSRKLFCLGILAFNESGFSQPDMYCISICCVIFLFFIFFLNIFLWNTDCLEFHLASDYYYFSRMLLWLHELTSLMSTVVSHLGLYPDWNPILPMRIPIGSNKETLGWWRCQLSYMSCKLVVIHVATSDNFTLWVIRLLLTNFERFMHFAGNICVIFPFLCHTWIF